MDNDFMIGAIVGMMIAFSLSIFIVWSNDRTDKLMTAMNIYEICIERQYGMTVHQYRFATGEMPECYYK